MHTIKITPNLLLQYQCTSGKFIRLPNRIESKNRFGSENRIESKLFLPELECSSAETFLYSGFIDDAVFSHNRRPCVDACRYGCSDVALVDVVLFLNFVKIKQ